MTGTVLPILVIVDRPPTKLPPAEAVDTCSTAAKTAVATPPKQKTRLGVTARPPRDAAARGCTLSIRCECRGGPAAAIEDVGRRTSRYQRLSTLSRMRIDASKKRISGMNSAVGV